MGSFIANLHLHSDDSQPLLQFLKSQQLPRCYVSKPRSGWVSLYEQQLSNQDSDWIRQFGCQLTETLRRPAIACLVHDSDFLQYWLFDNGQLVDEFDSCPAYFAELDESPQPAATVSTDHAQILKRVLPITASEAQIGQVLSQTPIFAESQLQELATLLGIDPQRAVVDFDHFESNSRAVHVDVDYVGTEPEPAPSNGSSPSALRLFHPANVNEADDLDDRESLVARELGSLIGEITSTLQPAAKPPNLADQRPVTLVDAAADGNAAAIAEMLAAGANIEASAPRQLPVPGNLRGLGSLVARMMPSVDVNPLFAAIMHQHSAVVQQLIAAGANVQATHAKLGTPLHFAASLGAPDILQALLDAGAHPNSRNPLGQTPLEVLETLKPMISQLGKLSPLGLNLGGASDLAASMPHEAWADCERILKSAQDDAAD